MWRTHSSPSRTALQSALFLGLLLAAQTLAVRHRTRLDDSDVQETLSSLYNSITDEQNFIEDRVSIEDPILDLPAGHSPIADVALGARFLLPSLPNGASQDQSALVETEAASTTDVSAAAEASLKAATAVLSKVDLGAEVKSTQMDKVTAEVANKETAQTGSSLPPFEALPSMAPHDGLDGDGFGPLSNPGKFDGAMMDPIARIEAIKLPPASSLVPRYLGSDLPLNDMRYTPVGSSSLPPLVGPQVGARPSPVPDPKLVLPDHPDLQLVDSFGIPGQPLNDGLPPLPPPLPPLDVTPDVAAALNAAHTSMSHYPAGAPMAPQVNLPHPPDPKAAMDLDALAFPIAPPILSPILPPVVGTPSNTAAFHGYANSRQQYTAQRTAALATMDARRKQIEQLQQWVDSGDTYLAQKQAQVSSWVAQERARATLALNAQKQKVEAYRRHLTALQQQQKEDAKRLNLINTELRRLSVQYQLTLHQQSVAQTEAQAKKLQDELKEIKSKKDSLQKEMKDISAEMGEGKSKGSNAGSEAGGEDAAGSNGASGDSAAAAGDSAEF